MEQPNHLQLYRAIGNLEGKVDQLLLESKERTGKVKENSERLTSLEKHRNIRYGAESLLGATLLYIGWPTIKVWLGM